MDLLSVILIGVGLAMDCFAVSTLKGVQTARHPQVAAGQSVAGWVVMMAVLFGVFQGGMPLIGYAAGSLFVSFIDKFDHWIALALLSFIGGKMIVGGEVLDGGNDDGDEGLQLGKGRLFSLKDLLLLAVATSIDALATGLIFTPYTWSQVLLYGSIIAGVSFGFTLLGFVIGKKAGKRLKVNVEVIGGLVLIGIGVKIFVEGMGWM